MALPVPPMSEVVAGLKQNLLFQAFLVHLTTRRDNRIIAAIKARDNVDVLRGRASDMMDLVAELEKPNG